MGVRAETTAVVSQTIKARVCKLWDACRATAQRPVDWRLAAGQLNKVRVCYCCTLAGDAPANSIGLTKQHFAFHSFA